MLLTYVTSLDQVYEHLASTGLRNDTLPAQLTKTHGGLVAIGRKGREGRTFDFVVRCNTSLLGLPVAR